MGLALKRSGYAICLLKMVGKDGNKMNSHLLYSEIAPEMRICGVASLEKQ